MQANIFVYDVIGEDTTLKDVRNQLKMNSGFDSVLVHINSVGGDVMEGYAIHDYLRSLNVPITTKIEGKCYSIATVVALSGDTRIMSENSDYMIHNPWMGNQQGDSKHFQKVAEQLQVEENKLAKFYATKIGKPVQEIEAMMEKETYMKQEDAMSLGFVNEEEKRQLKAVAQLKTEIKMDEVKKKEAVGLVAKMQKLLGLETSAEMDEDKKPEAEGGADAPKSMVLEDGTFKLEDGREIVVTDGVVQIKMETPEEAPEEEAEAMKKKIAELEAQLTQAKAEKDESAKAVETSRAENDAKIKALAEQVEKFSNLVVSEDAPKAVGKKNVTAKSERVDEGAQKLAQMREEQMTNFKGFYN